MREGREGKREGGKDEERKEGSEEDEKVGRRKGKGGIWEGKDMKNRDREGGKEKEGVSFRKRS